MQFLYIGWEGNEEICCICAHMMPYVGPLQNKFGGKVPSAARWRNAHEEQNRKITIKMLTQMRWIVYDFDSWTAYSMVRISLFFVLILRCNQSYPFILPKSKSSTLYTIEFCQGSFNVLPKGHYCKWNGMKICASDAGMQRKPPPALFQQPPAGCVYINLWRRSHHLVAPCGE